MANSNSDEKTRDLHKVYASEDPEKSAEIYDGWSKEYEQHMQGVGYTHPAIVASMLARILPSSDLPILDAGTGTGILGEILTAIGYTNLIGFDASKGMLELAKTKNIYQDLQTGFLGEKLNYEDDYFIASVASGVFTQGHAPLDGLTELVRITQPGGHIIFTISRTYLGKPFEKFSKAFIEAGKWQQVDCSSHYDSAPLAKETLTSQAFAFTVL